MESNALEKSTDNIVASRFFFTRTPSRIRRIVKICDVVDLISPKAILVLPKYFLNFRFYVVALLSIEDLSRYGFKGYTSVVLGYSKVTLLREREDAYLCPSVYCVLVIYSNTVSELYVVEYPCLPYFWGYFIKPCCKPNGLAARLTCWGLSWNWSDFNERQDGLTANSINYVNL